MRSFLVSVMLTATLVGAAADVVFGNGRIDSERRSVPAFKSISIAGSGTLRVHKGGQKVEITGDSNILPYVTTTVSGGELKIGLKPFTSLMRVAKLQFDVSLPELSAVRVAGSGDAYVDAFKGDSFEGAVAGSGGIKADLAYERVSLKSSGSGGFDATVKAASLDLHCTGSGGAYIKGSADRADIAISGSGALGAKSFAVGEAKLSIMGSGEAEIKVVKRLDVVLSGSGSVRYWGSPAVNQRVSGSGQVSRVGI